MQTDSSRVSPQQIKLIHTLKSRLGLPDSAYRSMLGDYHVRSSTQLTSDGADQLIWTLQKNAENRQVWTRPARKYENLAGRRNMATPRQLRMVEAMWAGVSRASNMAERAAALNSFLTRFGAAKIEDVQYWQVGKIVEALKAMKPGGKA
ncbi:MAG: phage protein GemA/Gp16 family protein [Elusimicrobiales bacterium]